MDLPSNICSDKNLCFMHTAIYLAQDVSDKNHLKKECVLQVDAYSDQHPYPYHNTHNSKDLQRVAKQLHAERKGSIRKKELHIR